jgi:ATP adenylyltransferase
MSLQRIWAPWRRAFVEGAERTAPRGPTGCIFCDYPVGGVSRETYVVHVEPRAFVMLNRYPYTGGHVLVIPRVHTADVGSVPAETWQDAARLLQRTCRLVGQAWRVHGLNVGMNVGEAAGAGIKDHLHWHVVPRWAGDTNFITTVGETRVVMASLDESFDRLCAAFEQDAPVP